MSGDKDEERDVQTQSQVTAPWEKQQPYLTTGFEQAKQRFLDDPVTYYEGNTVAPFATETEESLNQRAQMAREGFGPLNQANQLAEQTLRGDYLYGGPGFDAAVDAAYRKAKPRIDSQFGLAGGHNSGLADEAMAGAIGDAFAQQYNQERQRQMQMAGMAPGLDQARYFDTGQLGAVGAQRQAQQQAEINADVNKFNYMRDEGRRRLQDYMAAISGNYGGTKTGFQHQYNDGTSGLGNALMMSGNPYAIAGGATLNAAESGDWGQLSPVASLF